MLRHRCHNLSYELCISMKTKRYGCLVRSLASSAVQAAEAFLAMKARCVLQAVTSDVVDGLFSMLASQSIVPIIRCPKVTLPPCL